MRGKTGRKCRFWSAKWGSAGLAEGFGRAGWGSAGRKVGFPHAGKAFSGRKWPPDGLGGHFPFGRHPSGERKPRRRDGNGCSGRRKPRWQDGRGLSGKGKAGWPDGRTRGSASLPRKPNWHRQTDCRRKPLWKPHYSLDYSREKRTSRTGSQPWSLPAQAVGRILTLAPEREPSRLAAAPPAAVR